MRVFTEIDHVDSEAANAKPPVSRKKLHLASTFLVLFLTFSMLGISLSSTGLAAEVRQIASYFVPNLTDLGKLKFVDGEQSELEVMGQISDFAMPFISSEVTSLGDGEFEVNGLGSMIVRSCLKGVVSSISTDGQIKTVTISHGKNLKTEYAGIDTLGVKKGDAVEKNTPLGLSKNSCITFRVLYRDKVMAGLVVSNGEFSFL